MHIPPPQTTATWLLTAGYAIGRPFAMISWLKKIQISVPSEKGGDNTRHTFQSIQGETNTLGSWLRIKNFDSSTKVSRRIAKRAFWEESCVKKKHTAIRPKKMDRLCWIPPPLDDLKVRGGEADTAGASTHQQGETTWHKTSYSHGLKKYEPPPPGVDTGGGWAKKGAHMLINFKIIKQHQN